MKNFPISDLFCIICFYFTILHTYMCLSCCFFSLQYSTNGSFKWNLVIEHEIQCEVLFLVDNFLFFFLFYEKYKQQECIFDSMQYIAFVQQYFCERKNIVVNDKFVTWCNAFMVYLIRQDFQCGINRKKNDSMQLTPLLYIFEM